MASPAMASPGDGGAEPSDAGSSAAWKMACDLSTTDSAGRSTGAKDGPLMRTDPAVRGGPHPTDPGAGDGSGRFRDRGGRGWTTAAEVVARADALDDIPILDPGIVAGAPAARQASGHGPRRTAAEGDPRCGARVWPLPGRRRAAVGMSWCSSTAACRCRWSGSRLTREIRDPAPAARGLR